MKIEILNNRSKRDPSSFKAWHPHDEMIDAHVVDAETLGELPKQGMKVFKKFENKLIELIARHNETISMIGMTRFNERSVSMFRLVSDALEAEIIMTTEILNDYLDKALDDARRIKRMKNKKAA